MSGIYKNPHIPRRKIWHLLAWAIGLYRSPEAVESVPHGFKYPNNKVHFNSLQPWIEWINHSTFLIQIDKYRILTDPIWSKRCSPFKNIGPKRKVKPAFSLAELFPVDLVMISHNHYDHLDKIAIEYFKNNSPDTYWIVPEGVKPFLRKRGIKNVIEAFWWEDVQVPGIDLEFHFVPAQHFSGRGLFDGDRSLWGGWVCKSPSIKKFYFAGDTGYNSKDFKEIGRRFGPFDLSIIPIGAYLPRKLMAPIHCNPQEAVFIHQDVQSKLSIASHWKTFSLAEELMEQPPYDLYLSLQQANIDHSAFRVLDIGQRINW